MIPGVGYTDSGPLQLSRRYFKARGIPPHIVFTVEDRATDLFLASHVPRDTVFIRGCFEYLPEFRRSNSSNHGFSAALNAAALASYGNIVLSTSILTQARTYLGTAIRYINSALTSPTEAVKDSTIISIMLLATFETITCKDQRSLKDCDMHTKGAGTIIELRGNGQFQSRLGMQLFVQMCGDISRGCLQSGERIPKGVIKAREHAAGMIGYQDCAWELSDIVVDVAEFRASVKEGSLSDPDGIKSQGIRLDARLLILLDTIPEKNKFEVMQSAPSYLIWGTFYHVYPSFWAAYFWNNIRTCRILLHQELHRQSNRPGEEKTSQSLLSHDIIRQMSLDICATVPQYSGFLPSLVSFINQTGGEHATPPPPKLLPGSSVHAHAVYSLIWPLLIVGTSTESQGHRQWIIERARDIGRTTGIHQAFALADVLEKSEQIYV